MVHRLFDGAFMSSAHSRMRCSLLHCHVCSPHKMSLDRLVCPLRL